MNDMEQRAPARGRIARARAAPLVLLLAACGGGADDTDSRMSVQGGISGSGIRQGNLVLALADAPACGFDKVYVTVQGLRFKQDASPGNHNPPWVDVPLPGPWKVDLLTLTGGAAWGLGTFGVPAGTYTQMRVVLAPNDAAHPLANSVVPAGGVETPLATPSAQQSGMKADIAMTVPADGVGSYVIDVDACQSVVAGGQPGTYVLNPVIQVVPAGPDRGPAGH